MTDYHGMPSSMVNEIAREMVEREWHHGEQARREGAPENRRSQEWLRQWWREEHGNNQATDSEIDYLLREEFSG